MIVDVHTHLMWYPDHIDDTFAEEALAAKRVKLAQSAGLAYSSHLDMHSYDSRPEEHWAAAAPAERVVVFGLQAKATGVWVPNDLIAEYVASHPDKLVGFASIDPNDPRGVAELQRCVQDLGLRGLKVGPAYQHFDPTDRKLWPLFAGCAELDIPVIWHQGATFPSRASLRLSSPLLLEDIALAFPALRMIVAHLGHPWETDLIVLMRKAPNLYADISAVHYRPWRYWQAMVTAMEYGVSDRLLLGSDFPSATVTQVIQGLERVNDIVAGTRLPRVPDEVIHAILHDNWRAALPELA